MTLPTSAYRGYAGVTWDTVTVQKIIDYLTSTFTTPALDARYDARYAPFARDARGVAAWIRGFPAVATTGEAQIFTTQANVQAGRMYEVAMMNVAPDQGNTKSTEFRLRYTTDGSAPSNSSTQMAISLRLSTFELGAIRALYVPGSNLTLRVRASIASLDAANVRSWCPGDGGIVMINDVGPSIGQVGTAP